MFSSDARPPLSRFRRYTPWIVAICYVGVVNLSDLWLLRAGTGLLLGLLLVVGLRSPALFFECWLALMPVRSRLFVLWQGYGFDVSFDRLLLGSAIVVWMMAEVRGRTRGRASPAVLCGVAGFLVFELVRALLNDGALADDAKQVAMVVSELVIVPALFWRVLGASYSDLPLRAFAGGTVVLGVCVVIERVTGVNLLLRFPTDIAQYVISQEMSLLRDDVLRVRGPFFSPVFLAASVPLFLYPSLALLGRSKLQVATLTFLSTCAITALGISRTGIYSFVIMLVPCLVLIAKHRGVGIVGRLLKVVLLSFGALLVLFLPDVVRLAQLAFQPSAEQFEGANTESRIWLLTEGVPMTLGGNAFGLGFDQAAIAAIQRLSDDVANFYVSSGLHRGWVWVAGFCMWAAWQVGSLWHQRTLESKMLSVLLTSLLATYLSFADFYLTLPMFLVFWATAPSMGGRVGAIRRHHRRDVVEGAPSERVLM